MNAPAEAAGRFRGSHNRRPSASEAGSAAAHGYAMTTTPEHSNPRGPGNQDRPRYYECCECCATDALHPDVHTFPCLSCQEQECVHTPEWRAAHDREVAVNTLRAAAGAYPSLRRDMVSRGDVVRWLNARADRIEKGDDHD